jgi:thiol-disulfide isomerase/thioredoxin
MMHRFIIISIFILAGQLVMAQDEFTLAKKGSVVPQFNYESAPGVVKSIGDLKGKVVLITFFATWCGPCRQELPHIEKEIWQKYGSGDPFELLIFGREHDWATVNKFKADQKFTMPFYPDTGRVIFSKFAGQNIPRNFLLDRDGNIIFSSVGFNEKDFDKLKLAIEKALRIKK